MVSLEFLVDENYLLTHTLFHESSRQKYGKDISRLQNMGVSLIPQIGVVPQGAYREFILLKAMLADTLSPAAQKLASRLKQMHEYQRVLKMVQRQKSVLESLWLANHDKTERMMQEITGLDFANDQFTVYLTLLKDGRYMGNRRIVWGSQKERYPSSHVVDLWHEIMHGKIKVDGKYNPSCDDIEHSVIQLATDNELRVRLNGGQYPPLVGHEHHLSLVERMLPYWRKYLGSPGRNILDFYREMEKMRKNLTR